MDSAPGTQTRNARESQGRERERGGKRVGGAGPVAAGDEGSLDPWLLDDVDASSERAMDFPTPSPAASPSCGASGAWEQGNRRHPSSPGGVSPGSNRQRRSPARALPTPSDVNESSDLDRSGVESPVPRASPGRGGRGASRGRGGSRGRGRAPAATAAPRGRAKKGASPGATDRAATAEEALQQVKEAVWFGAVPIEAQDAVTGAAAEARRRSDSGRPWLLSLRMSPGIAQGVLDVVAVSTGLASASVRRPQRILQGRKALADPDRFVAALAEILVRPMEADRLAVRTRCRGCLMSCVAVTSP